MDIAPSERAARLVPLQDSTAFLADDTPGHLPVIPASAYGRLVPVFHNVQAIANPETRRRVLRSFAEREQHVPNVSIHLFRNALTFGAGIIQNNGKLVQETLHGVPEALLRPTGNVVSVKESCVWLRKYGDWNYGHWLMELLPKVGVVQQADDDLATRARYCIRRGGPVNHIMHESLALAGIHPEQIMEMDDVPTLFDSLIYPAPVSLHPEWKVPFVFGFLEALAAKALAGGPSEARRRIFVTREPAHPRQLLNQDEIAGILKRRGFAIVSMDGLSLTERIRIFANADTIVGVFGASMTNMTFAPNGAAVILLAPDTVPALFYWDIACHKRQRYAQLHGEAQAPKQMYSDFVLEPALLEEALHLLDVAA